MRQNITADSSVKLFEAYMDFSGGKNSEISNERLRENEYPVMENIDLSGRGSAKIRTGRVKILDIPGVAQGMFPYYRTGQPSPDTILAIGGKLYVKTNGSNTASEVVVTDGGSAFTFQTAHRIEAVQYNTKLFVATGTKLVELWYTGTVWTANTVQPYTPTVLEAIYIGTNGLATNPDAYVADGTGALSVIGIKPAKRSGTANQAIALTTYINKPAGMNIGYKWEYKKSADTAYTLGQDFSTSAKTWNFTPASAGTWDIKVTVRDEAAQTTTATYILPSFVVNSVEDKANTALPVSGINTCRGIRLHWERLLLFKDSSNPYQMYVSDLQNPYYFPVTNTLNFNTGKQEPITAVERFQDMLVVFTKTTIQTLLGKSPEDYKRYVIHDGIGCIADWSAKVVGNVVLFRSAEGVQRLRPNQYRLETMNVDRVDAPVKSEIPADEDACAMVYDNQYWLAFPQRNLVYRYYYETGAWVVDKSPKLDILQFFNYGFDVYNLTTTGSLYKHDNSVYTDDGTVYDMIVESKFLDLSASFNRKRLKKLYVLARHFTTNNVDLEVTVQADSAVILTPDTGSASIDPATDTVVWTTTTEPNMHFYAGTAFGQWILGVSPFGNMSLSVQSAAVRGKCRRVKVRLAYKGGKSCEIYGFGLEFKQKKV